LVSQKTGETFTALKLCLTNQLYPMAAYLLSVGATFHGNYSRIYYTKPLVMEVMKLRKDEIDEYRQVEKKLRVENATLKKQLEEAVTKNDN